MDLPRDIFQFPGWADFLQVGLRLLLASVFGALLGLERERVGKAAGLRTHTLVALGAALFTVAAQVSRIPLADLSRIIQGIATGVGFIGAGTILKSTREHEISGLTTAAGLWLTSAVGIAAGIGNLWISVLAVVLALIVLRVLRHLEADKEPDRQK
jgi:putative Mg2+ transporter-C (MgtC) family protein